MLITLNGETQMTHNITQTITIYAMLCFAFGLLLFHTSILDMIHNVVEQTLRLFLDQIYIYIFRNNETEHFNENYKTHGIHKLHIKFNETTLKNKEEGNYFYHRQNIIIVRE